MKILCCLAASSVEIRQMREFPINANLGVFQLVRPVWWPVWPQSIEGPKQNNRSRISLRLITARKRGPLVYVHVNHLFWFVVQWKETCKGNMEEERTKLDRDGFLVIEVSPWSCIVNIFMDIWIHLNIWSGSFWRGGIDPISISLWRDHRWQSQGWQVKTFWTK